MIASKTFEFKETVRLILAIILSKFAKKISKIQWNIVVGPISLEKKYSLIIFMQFHLSHMISLRIRVHQKLVLVKLFCIENIATSHFFKKKFEKVCKI